MFRCVSCVVISWCKFWKQIDKFSAEFPHVSMWFPINFCNVPRESGKLLRAPVVGHFVASFYGKVKCQEPPMFGYFGMWCHWNLYRSCLCATVIWKSQFSKWKVSDNFWKYKLIKNIPLLRASRIWRQKKPRKRRVSRHLWGSIYFSRIKI